MATGRTFNAGLPAHGYELLKTDALDLLAPA